MLYEFINPGVSFIRQNLYKLVFLSSSPNLLIKGHSPRCEVAESDLDVAAALVQIRSYIRFTLLEHRRDMTIFLDICSVKEKKSTIESLFIHWFIHWFSTKYLLYSSYIPVLLKINICKGQ